MGSRTLQSLQLQRAQGDLADRNKVREPDQNSSVHLLKSFPPAGPLQLPIQTHGFGVSGVHRGAGSGISSGDSISDSMCSSILQFTQDIIAVLQKSSPVMGDRVNSFRSREMSRKLFLQFRLEMFSQIQRYQLREGRLLAEVPQINKG